MLKSLIGKKLSSEERRLGASLDYVRYILSASFKSFLKFARILPLSEHRKTLPAEPYYVAKLVATRDEDCGSCVQIEVNLAKEAGVGRAVLEAVLARRPDDLPGDLALVYRFAEAVVTASGAEEEMRDALKERYGDKGLVELALGMASCRVFPIVKRSLGYAKSCAAVQVTV